MCTLPISGTLSAMGLRSSVVNLTASNRISRMLLMRAKRGPRGKAATNRVRNPNCRTENTNRVGNLICRTKNKNRVRNPNCRTRNTMQTVGLEHRLRMQTIRVQLYSLIALLIITLSISFLHC